jgi:glutaconate CoA-transferase, subunit A
MSTDALRGSDPSPQTLPRSRSVVAEGSDPRLPRRRSAGAEGSDPRLVTPYQQLRKATLDRDRGLREKVMSLEAAAELVGDGDHVGIGGCTMSRTPIAMIWALIRAHKKDLMISRSITSTEGDLLFASGVSKHVITSWFTQGIVWGVSKVMRHYTESKLARFDEWSHMSIGLRYRAGAMGIPFMPSRSMIGSDVGKRVGDELKTMTCPFTDEEIVLLPALNPDVALIHVQRCDAYGNAQLDGLQFMDIDMAMAANQVILTTERIVSNDQIRRTPDLTRIPFFTVEAVVEAPMGCAPHECYGLYEPFFSHLDDYAERTAKDPVKGCQQYLEEFYYGPKSWPDYLSKLGMEAVLDACRRGRSVHND